MKLERSQVIFIYLVAFSMKSKLEADATDSLVVSMGFLPENQHCHEIADNAAMSVQFRNIFIKCTEHPMLPA